MKSTRTLSLVLVCFISLSSYASSFKALWWNIGFHHKQVNNNLDQNLANIVTSDYDIIGLGEVILTNFSEDTKKLIELKYPYRKYLKYGVLEKNGFWILSKTDFKLKVNSIDWTPVGINKLDKEEYIAKSFNRYGKVMSFYRDQALVSLVKNGRAYNIVFYHLSNPWPALVNKKNKYYAAWEILTGQSNPVMNQISHLRENLKSEFGESYYNERIVMMGDSNCPRKIKGIATTCYRKLLRALPAVLDNRVSFTYPADEDQGYKVRIDHAQVSRQFDNPKLKVLRIKGSDHYPLSLTLDD